MTINPNIKVGLSKPCDLRPPNIKLFESIPRNICVCIYHENKRLLLEVLSKYTKLSESFQDFVDQVTCDPSFYDCNYRKCHNCIHLLDTFKPAVKQCENVVRYFQWKSSPKTEKIEITAAIGDTFEDLQRKTNAFLVHRYVKRKQAAHMEELIASCDGKNIVLQVDFSENATIKMQNEIQSNHWNHSQATLFTAHAWITTKLSENIVIVSDDLTHNKYSVYIFMKSVIENLLAKHPEIKLINIFSDGARSQFKQKFTLSNLPLRESILNIKLT